MPCKLCPDQHTTEEHRANQCRECRCYPGHMTTCSQFRGRCAESDAAARLGDGEEIPELKTPLLDAHARKMKAFVVANEVIAAHFDEALAIIKGEKRGH